MLSTQLILCRFGEGGTVEVVLFLEVLVEDDLHVIVQFVEGETVLCLNIDAALRT